MPTPPRYLAVLAALDAQVARLPPNSLLPTEEALATQFGVSRGTLRRALGFLQRSGRISRQRGQGTVVSPPRLIRHIIPVRTLEQDLAAQGVRLETRVLAYQPRVVPPADIRQRLALRRRSQPGYLALLRAVDGRPICFEQRYLAPAIARTFVPAQLGARPVIHALQDAAGQPIGRNAWRMEILPARGAVATALHLVPGVLTIVHTFTEYLSDGPPLDAGSVWYRLDRVAFEFVAVGPSLQFGPSPSG